MGSLAVFGSTGTIGKNTLRIVDQFPEQFAVRVLTAGKNIDLLGEQIERYSPTAVCVQEESDRRPIQARFPDLQVYAGAQGLVEIVRDHDCDVLLMGIVGFAALAPTLEAVRLGRRIGLANKESLVVAGHLLRTEQRRSGAVIIPVDSEHNAIFQLLEGRNPADISSIVLTASGGPLLRRPELPLPEVTPEIAIAHPNWKMGPKISVDSATMMNKGLEVIEAQILFDLPEERIEVWVHPQSIVHGAVWLKDNSCLAHLSVPDMRSAIGHAVAAPRRLAEVVPKLSFAQMANLEFLKPDPQRFPALSLARTALRGGPSHLIVLNAVNEVAVDAFLKRELRFDQIAQLVEKVLTRHPGQSVEVLEDIYVLDRRSREQARTEISK